MPRLNVLVSEEIFNLLQRLPKANRGPLVTASVEYFINTADGQKIVSFLTANKGQEMESASLPQHSSETSEIVENTNDMGIDTSDWSV
jgi:proteasome assembly chaperone (PAC2) family protein